MTRLRLPCLILAVAALAALPLLASGCGDHKKKPVENPAQEEIEPDRWKDAPATRIRFRDVSAQGGITAVNHSGRAGVKEFLFEAVGPGAAWFDYDGDGLLDLYVPDGDVFRNYDLAVVRDQATGRDRPVLQPKAERLEVHTDRLWRNRGDGSFEDVSEKAGIHDARWSFGATPFDYDADGDQDVFVANFGLNRLWRNNGDGTFTDVAAEVGLAGDPFTWHSCAAVADIDGDDRLDLYVAAYSDVAHEVDRLRVKQGLPLGTPVESISGRDCAWRGIKAYCGPIGLKAQHDIVFHQREDGTFQDVTVAWGLRPRAPKYAFTCLAYDFNDDGLIDIYVANDSEENFMWQQERASDGTILFRDTSDVLGIKVGQQVTAQASMGMSANDIDRDGRFDISITNFSHDYNNLYMAKQVEGSGTTYFKDRGLQTMSQQVWYDLSWGIGWYDFDNDTDLDLFVANGHVYKEIDLFSKTGTSYDQLNALFENMDPATLGFREIGAKAQKNAAPGVDTAKLDAGDGMAVARCSRQAAFGDFNDDGRVDVFVSNLNDAPTLLLGEGPAGGPDAHWIKLSFRQPGANREALGASFTVMTPDAIQRHVVIRQKSFLGCDDPRQHVGLGTAAACDVGVIWPGRARATSRFEGLAAGKHWLLDRASGEAVELPLKPFAVPAAR